MLLNKNKYAVVREFLDKDKGIHGSYIAKKNSLNQKTVSNILNSLEKENILRFEREGRNKIYFLNKENPLSKYFVQLIEIEKKAEFIQRNKKLEKMFNSLLKISNGILIVFGSYAKGNNKKDSDLDLLIIGKIEEVKDIEESFGIEINVVNFDKKKFDKKDNFVKEVLENHIVLKGVEDFVNLIW